MTMYELVGSARLHVCTYQMKHTNTHSALEGLIEKTWFIKDSFGVTFPPDLNLRNIHVKVYA